MSSDIAIFFLIYCAHCFLIHRIETISVRSFPVACRWSLSRTTGSLTNVRPRFQLTCLKKPAYYCSGDISRGIATYHLMHERACFIQLLLVFSCATLSVDLFWIKLHV